MFTKVMVMVAAYLQMLGDTCFPVPQRLTAEGGLGAVSCRPTPNDGQTLDIVGFHHQQLEVPPEPHTQCSLHWGNSGHSGIQDLSSAPARAGLSVYDSDFSVSVLRFCGNG